MKLRHLLLAALLLWPVSTEAAFNGSGTFNRIYDWTDDRDNGINIDADRMDEEMDGMATGLSSCIVKDGQTTITANLPMSGFIHTGVGNASARNHYCAVGQIQDQSFIWVGTAGGTANALTLTPSPAITAYAAGQSFVFKAGSSDNSGATTVAISGLSTIAIQYNGEACIGGEIQANKWYRITLDSTSTAQLEGISTQLPFIDTLSVLRGSSDNTKQSRFEVDGHTTATTRVHTLPNRDGTLADDTDLALKANLASPTFTGTPAAPTATVGTNTTQLATTAFVQAAGQFKMGSFTRDTSVASGTQAVTGVGFTPKAVIFLANQSGSKEFSVGLDDGTTKASVYQTSTAGTFSTNGNSIADDESSGSASYVGYVSSLDADGFTITWTKNGSPTGTLTVYYLAIR